MREACQQPGPSTGKANNRLETLDWLRGFAALSIMVYHVRLWHFSAPDASSFLGRMGIYGVSIFFVLSGLSMAVAYERFIVDLRTSAIFLVRRVFRIWPLLWVCVGLAVAPDIAQCDGPCARKVLANLTTTFGFTAPGNYINAGAWSIGNEVVYYVLTPFIILVNARSRLVGNVLAVVALGVAMVFSFRLLTPGASLAAQWGVYINPFHNLFFYLIGVVIYYNTKDLRFSTGAVLAAALVALGVFVFYPVAGNQIHIVVGPVRLVFMAATIAVVVAAYKFEDVQRVPRFARAVLRRVGDATYGVYLLYPVVDLYLSRALAGLGLRFPLGAALAAPALTVALAILSYEYFEKPIIRLGRALTAMPSSRAESRPAQV